MAGNPKTCLVPESRFTDGVIEFSGCKVAGCKAVGCKAAGCKAVVCKAAGCRLQARLAARLLLQRFPLKPARPNLLIKPA